MRLYRQWQAHTVALKQEIHGLYLAYRDPRTPWVAKAFTVLVVAYAFSPIDLIPDPIPVLGYLDDLILIPIGIWIAVRLLPPDILDEARARAAVASEQDENRIGWIGASIIVLSWLILGFLGIALLTYFF